MIYKYNAVHVQCCTCTHVYVHAYTCTCTYTCVHLNNYMYIVEVDTGGTHVSLCVCLVVYLIKFLLFLFQLYNLLTLRLHCNGGVIKLQLEQ